MSSFPFINIAAQYSAYQKDIDAALNRVLSSSIFIGGDEVTSLEAELASFCGAPHAISCSSGTDALLLALMAIDVQVGDEIILPSFTFVATAEVIVLLGCVPVFADVRAEDALIDVEHVKSLVSNRTKAIIPVSLFGQCPDMDALNAIGEANNITIIEDAAQSFGASYKGKRSCQLSSIACTSFFPAKPLGAYGDGGAVFTSQASVAEKIRQLRNHGQSSTYYYTSIGINGRMDAMQAAILRVKLAHFAQEIETRGQVAQRYISHLPQHIELLEVAAERVSTYAQFTLTTDKRDDLRQHLQAMNVPSAVYYPRPLHQQQVYQEIVGQLTLPVTEKLALRVLSLPMCAFLEQSNQEKVIDSVHSFFS